jgi:Fe-S-cluster containining protein
MCCDWSLFHSVRLERAEVPWASSKRLPLYQHDDQLSFRLPCAMLEVGEERVCGDYEHRPQACRVFECDLLERYRKGQVPRAEAFEIVARARTLIAGIEARLAKNTRYKDLARELDDLAVALEAGVETTRGLDPDLLFDLAVLRSRIWPAFRHPVAAPTPTGMNEPVLAERARDPETWRAIFGPWGDALPFDGELSAWEGAQGELREDGYTRLPGVLRAEEAQTLASMVARVSEAGWPAVFLFVHPLAWGLPRRFERWLAGILGEDFEMVSSLWVWNLAAGKAAQGWKPHRDRPGRTVLPDGAPRSLTVWVALSESDPDTGCIYLVPPKHDPHYGTSCIDVHDVQNIRALPARAGEALVWNHQVLHWGGRASRAGSARMSLAFEFARGDARDVGILSRDHVPPFEERLRVVGEQLLRFAQRGVEARFLELARDLASGAPRPPR